MKIISHGKWKPYTPIAPPEHLPGNILYYRRESDNKDWYDYIYQSDGDGVGSAKRFKVRDTFNTATIKCAAFFQDYYNAHTIGPVVTDITMICPHNQHVFEIVDYAGSGDPQEFFRGKAFDPDALTISDAPPPANTAPPPHRFLIVEVNELKNVIAAMQKQIDHLLGK